MENLPKNINYFLLINDYNTEVKVDVTKLNQIDFIEIKDS